MFQHDPDIDLLMPIKVNAYEHQKQAFAFALEQYQILSEKPPASKGVAFLCDMGTGKSLTALSVAGSMYQLGVITRVLIVAPLSVLSVWQEEFDKFAAFPYSLSVLQGSTEKKKQQLKDIPAAGLRVAIINYESVWRLSQEILSWDADLVICDEAHKLKDGSTKQAKALHQIGDKARYRLLLTGTLITNRELDVWSQYRFINPEIFGRSFYSFRNKYFYMTGYGLHTPVFKQSMLPEFLTRMHSIAFRTTKEECLDLPEYTDEIRTVDLELDAMKLYKKIERDSYAELKNSEITAANILTKLLRLLQISGGHVTDDGGAIRTVSHAKLDALEDILDTAQAEGQKIVIMARFRAEMDEIEKLLQKKHIGYATVRGGTKDRGGEVRRFQTDPDCTVFVGQIAAAGLGLTLTAASTMVFFSLDYSMASHDQARARIHRAGQKNRCLYIYLCARDTADRRVIQALRDKQDLARALVDDYRQGRNPYRV